MGGRTGWRFPGIQDLASLIDPAVAPPGPTLPAGHPFSNVESDYWSATTTARDAARAWGVSLFNGNVGRANKFDALRAWCVRGGPGVDPQ